MQVTNNRASLICHRIADRPEAPVPSYGAPCHLCRAPVWLAYDTVAGVIRLQRAGRLGRAMVVCVPCATPRLHQVQAVVTMDSQAPGAAAASAAALGVAAGTPVINLDRMASA
jgi:hypothetical protein